MCQFSLFIPSSPYFLVSLSSLPISLQESFTLSLPKPVSLTSYFLFSFFSHYFFHNSILLLLFLYLLYELSELSLPVHIFCIFFSWILRAHKVPWFHLFVSLFSQHRTHFRQGYTAFYLTDSNKRCGLLEKVWSSLWWVSVAWTSATER